MKRFKQFLTENKEYSAFVKDKQTGEKSIITRSYPSRADFEHDLRSNGYSIIRLAQKDRFDNSLNMSDRDREKATFQRKVVRANNILNNPNSDIRMRRKALDVKASEALAKGDMDAYKKYRDEEEKLWNEYKKTILLK